MPVFEENVGFQKFMFWFILPRGNDIICIFRALLKRTILN